MRLLYVEETALSNLCSTIICAYIYTGIETRSRCNNLSVGAYTEKVKGWLR